MSDVKQAHEPQGKSRSLNQAIHLRVGSAEAVRLEAYARRVSLERHAQVTLSEAVRELLAQALDRQEAPAWDVALRNLPFVTWAGGKAVLPPLETKPDGLSLAAIVLEDRGQL